MAKPHQAECSLDKCGNDQKKALFHIEEAIRNNWSRAASPRVYRPRIIQAGLKGPSTSREIDALFRFCTEKRASIALSFRLSAPAWRKIMKIGRPIR